MAYVFSQKKTSWLKKILSVGRLSWMLSLLSLYGSQLYAGFGNLSNTTNTTSAQQILMMTASLQNITVKGASPIQRYPQTVAPYRGNERPGHGKSYGRGNSGPSRYAHLEPSPHMFQKTPLPRSPAVPAQGQKSKPDHPVSNPIKAGMQPASYGTSRDKFVRKIKTGKTIVNEASGHHARVTRAGNLKWETRRQRKRREQLEQRHSDQGHSDQWNSGQEQVTGEGFAANNEPLRVKRQSSSILSPLDTTIWTDLGDILVREKCDPEKRRVHNTVCVKSNAANGTNITASLQTCDTPASQWSVGLPQPVHLDPGNCSDIPVTLAPVTAGAKSANLSIDCDGGNPACSQTVQITGQGLVDADNPLAQGKAARVGTLTRSEPASQMVINSAGNLAIGNGESVDVYEGSDSQQSGRYLGNTPITLTLPLRPAEHLCPGQNDDYIISSKDGRARLLIEACIQPPDSEFVRGRLEVLDRWDEWGTVCDDMFDNIDASVACRSVGLSHVGSVFLGKDGHGCADGSIQQQIVLDDLGCTGTEDTLFNCRHIGINTHNCAHSEDVHIGCRVYRGRLSPTCPEMKNYATGHLEITRNLMDWRPVCRDGFEQNESNAVCRNLGSTGVSLLAEGCQEPPLLNNMEVFTLNCTGVTDAEGCAISNTTNCSSGLAAVSCPIATGCAAPSVELSLRRDGLYSGTTLLQAPLVPPDKLTGGWCAPSSTVLFTSSNSETRIWTRTTKQDVFTSSQPAITWKGQPLTDLSLTPQPGSSRAFGVTREGKGQIFVLDGYSGEVSVQELSVPDIDNITLLAAANNGWLYASDGTKVHILDARAVGLFGLPEPISTTAISTTAIPATAIPATAIPATAIPATAIPATAIPAAAIPATAIPAAEPYLQQPYPQQPYL